METLKGMFLVSMPALKGDYFHHSVTLLIEHNEDGAFGLVINMPTTIKLGDIFPEIGAASGIELLEGGPVEQDRIFFLHSSEKQYEGTLVINADVSLSTSAQLISDIANSDAVNDRPPEKILAIVGYAGWGGNQLEEEILGDAWLVTPFNSTILYSDNHEKKPQDAARSMGIDLNLIGPNSGHG